MIIVFLAPCRALHACCAECVLYSAPLPRNENNHQARSPPLHTRMGGVAHLCAACRGLRCMHMRIAGVAHLCAFCLPPLHAASYVIGRTWFVCSVNLAASVWFCRLRYTQHVVVSVRSLQRVPVTCLNRDQLVSATLTVALDRETEKKKDRSYFVRLCLNPSTAPGRRELSGEWVSTRNSISLTGSTSTTRE